MSHWSSLHNLRGANTGLHVSASASKWGLVASGTGSQSCQQGCLLYCSPCACLWALTSLPHVPVWLTSDPGHLPPDFLPPGSPHCCLSLPHIQPAVLQDPYTCLQTPISLAASFRVLLPSSNASAHPTQCGAFSTAYSENYCTQPVCQLFAVDMAFCGSEGLVTDSSSALLVMVCTQPVQVSLVQGCMSSVPLRDCPTISAFALLVVVCMASVHMTRSHTCVAAVLLQQHGAVHGLPFFPAGHELQLGPRG